MKSEDLEIIKLKLISEKKLYGSNTLDAYQGNTDQIIDEIDLAVATADRELKFRIKDRSEIMLLKINLSLARIEDGTYGVCEECEQDISTNRLKANPTCNLCILCKEAQEELSKQNIVLSPKEEKY